MQVHYIWALVAGSLAVLVALSIFLRIRMIRRTHPKLGIVWQVCDEGDFGPSRLSEMQAPDWADGFKVYESSMEDTGSWYFRYQAGGLKRLFYILKCLDAVEEARLRWRMHKSLYCSLHLMGMCLLFGATALKALIRPSDNDMRMLIGYDSLASARLAWQAEKEEALAQGKRSLS